MAIVRHEGRAFILPNNPSTGETVVISGRIWTWDGEKWVSTPVPALPGGTDKQIQYNDDGLFGGAADMVWDKTNLRLGVNMATALYTLDVTGDANLNGTAPDPSYRINGIPFASLDATTTNTVNLTNIETINGASPFDVDVAPLTLVPLSAMVGVNQTTPAYALDVTGDANINGTAPNPSYRINGIPFAVPNANGTTINLTNVTTINGAEPFVDPSTTVGDLLVHNGTALARLPVGTDGQVLVANAAAANGLGVAWTSPAAVSVPVTTVFTRTGDIVAVSGDYNATLITLSPAIGTWTTVQEALDALDTDVTWMLANAVAAGAAGQIQFNDGGTPTAGFGASANLHWDSTNSRLGIGTAAPAYPLQVTGDMNITGTPPAPAYRINGIAFAIANADGTTVNLTNVTHINGAEPFVDPTTTLGDLLINDGTGLTRIGVGGDGDILVSDSADPLGVKWELQSNLAGNPAGAAGQIQFHNGATPTAGFGASANLNWDNTNSRLGIGIASPTYPLDVAGIINTTVGYYVNGVALAFNATQIDLSPGVSTWTTVQDAVSAIHTTIEVLARGMAYIGAYDAAGDAATFVTAVGIAAGPLPAANATGIHAGDYVVVTTATNTPAAITGATTLIVGDQLISDGTNWNRLPIGFAMAAITADLVPMNPVIGSWTTVQDAVTALNTRATPAGAAGQIQFHGGGTPAAFGASASLTWDGPSGTLTVGAAANALKIMLAAGSQTIQATTATAYTRMVIEGDPIFLNEGNVGIGLNVANPPLYKLEIGGDVNIDDPGGAGNHAYRINGVPLALPPSLSGTAAGDVLTVNAAGTAMVWAALPSAKPVVGAAPATPTEGQLWFDTTSMSMFIRVQGAWVGI